MGKGVDIKSKLCQGKNTAEVAFSDASQTAKQLEEQAFYEAHGGKGCLAVYYVMEKLFGCVEWIGARVRRSSNSL